MNVVFSWDGEYYALLLGFKYRDGRKHPKYDWVNSFPEDELDRIVAEEYAKGDDSLAARIGGRMRVAWRKLILTDPRRPLTVAWYDWKRLADSVKVTVS
jgi:hypothetical protein